ncbi:MAG: DUF4258 domain-containing protein [Planctomycetes bacterium]|nr:DUF4258 domain-containing protein [Planctomycetota bacterium]
MGRLFETIKELVADDQYIVGEHAAARLEERDILEWQVVTGLEMGKLIKERKRDNPNPAVEVLEVLPDGTSFMAVWSYIRSLELVKLVTVHYFDEDSE